MFKDLLSFARAKQDFAQLLGGSQINLAVPLHFVFLII